jgi:hypothetical protein
LISYTLSIILNKYSIYLILSFASFLSYHFGAKKQGSISGFSGGAALFLLFWVQKECRIYKKFTKLSEKQGLTE